MRITVDVSEVHQLADDLRRNADTLSARAERLVADTGHAMHATALAKSPQLTGAMDASDALSISGLGFELGPTVDYGVYVELGTSKMAAEPFLGPAFDEHLPRFESALGGLGEQAVDRA